MQLTMSRRAKWKITNTHAYNITLMADLLPRNSASYRPEM